MDATKPPSYNVIPLANRYNNISPNDLENILETLQDMGYLSEEGMQFAHKFWKLFIKE
jgi:hypothetical protein